MAPLRKYLYSKDDDVSYFSALAIGQISTIPSVSTLMKFLKDRPGMRRKTASILESLSPDITDEVIKYTDDQDPEVRAWAARLLAKSVSKEYIKKVESMTGDEYPEVRVAACSSLAKLNDRGCKKSLVKCLEDDDWSVRAEAVTALSSIFRGDAMPEIVNLLNDGSLSVIDSVRRAMARDIETALPHIERIYKGKDELARKSCAHAIEDAAVGLDVRSKKSIIDKARSIGPGFEKYVRKILEGEEVDP
jgi:hypothetical protein